jgi:Uma2 family endonuclease
MGSAVRKLQADQSTAIPVPPQLKLARLRLGPRDHGTRLTYDQFQHAQYEYGYRYELIHGRLYVVTTPRLPHDWLEQWLLGLIRDYAKVYPRIINFVANKAAVFVPSLDEETCPEPDIAAYRGFPIHRLPEVQWQDVSPILIVEVLSEGSIEKDLVRNVELYLQVPSIREYWILDGLTNASRPSLKVHRRRGKRWQIIDVPLRKTYTTKLLPGFTLKIDPKA